MYSIPGFRKYLPSSILHSLLLLPVLYSSVAYSTRLRHIPLPDPGRKLPSLLPDIHKPGPALQCPKGVTDIVLLDLPTPIYEALLAFSLDLAGPHAPLYWSKVWAAEHEAETDEENGDGGLDGDI
jgi:hypothetical protein